MQFIYIITGLLICFGVEYSSKFTFKINQRYLKSFPPNFLMQIYFAICSLILMYLFRYELKFNIKYSNVFEIVFQSFFLFFISFFILKVIFDIIEKKYPVEEEKKEENRTFSPPNQKIFLFMVMCINPITEGLLYRGFLLNHILSANYLLSDNIFMNSSIPILISGLYFGLTHLSLLKGGMNKYSVYFIVIGGVIVGSACGYYYIRFDSFTAAIIVHAMANITSGATLSFKEKLIKP